jgi:2-polyprenyl-3-methyl-5-hydroxy-6-metoxy-1,4-benzoquinol methylase
MEVQFFEPGTVPEWTTTPWYEQRVRAPHLEEPGHRGRLLLAAEFVREAIAEHGATSLSDMGAGDGGLLSLVSGEIAGWGYDLMPANVQAAIDERAVDVRRVDILTDPVKYGDICVLTEVLEHLIDPHGFLVACPSRLVVASSPDNETRDCHYEFHT